MSDYHIKQRSVFNADGKHVSEVYELFDADDPDDEGMFFTTYENAEMYKAKLEAKYD